MADDGASLLEVLRDRLGARSAKDGCSPQGQCGCCTVWVDGQARVSCVTPLARVEGRSVTTLDGLADAAAWGEAFAAAGASQCGFCTPGIIIRAAAMTPAARQSPAAVHRALAAHLCRCTGWQSIVDTVLSFDVGPNGPASKDRSGAEQRARLEGGTAQSVGPATALGRAGFADDLAPDGALVAVLGRDGEWHVGETLTEARRRAGTVQGRRSTAALSWPVELPPGEWYRTLQTTWVEPGYLEPDASWCVPGGEPVTPLANGGAFGGKLASDVGAVARRLADEHGRPVCVRYAREDVVRRGPKRPPIAAGVARRRYGCDPCRPHRRHRRRAVRGGRSGRHGRGGRRRRSADVSGGPRRGVGRGRRAARIRGRLPGHGLQPGRRDASATVDGAGVHVRVRCGDPLDDVVLRSYCTGAAHMALGWVRSEGLAVGVDGVPVDLTIRSFGILRAVDTPAIDVADRARRRAAGQRQ